MASSKLEPSAEDAALESDPSFRQEVVEGVIEEAERRGIPIDYRCRRLLTQYADGDIDFLELDRQVIRLAAH